MTAADGQKVAHDVCTTSFEAHAKQSGGLTPAIEATIKKYYYTS
jgi:hypothetical protein